MQGVIKTLTDKGFGFIAVEAERDEFFHSNALNGVMYEDLKVGDVVTFEIELIPRKLASSEIIRNSDFVLPYGEQKIVTPMSLQAIELQEKVTAEFIRCISKNPFDLHQLTPKQFEELIAELYVIDGYTVELLGSWNQADGGVDILAIKDVGGRHNFRTAIQCKRYATKNRVSAAPIRSLAGVLDRFHAHAGALVTTSEFTKPAMEEASYYWQIDLVNFQGIVEKLRRAKLLMPSPAVFSTDRTSQVASNDLRMFRCAVKISRA